MTDFRFICVRFILFILDLKILSVTERHTYVYCTNIKREYTLDVSFWSQSRIKVECFVRIISVSTRCISYSYLNNRESSLSVLHE